MSECNCNTTLAFDVHIVKSWVETLDGGYNQDFMVDMLPVLYVAIKM